MFAFTVACATSSPNVVYYTMDSLADAQQPLMEENALSIAMGPAEFPNYLQRNQLVMRKDNRLHVEDFHRWGASFETMVLSTLGENVRHLINSPRIVVYPGVPRFALNYRIVMDVLQLEGALGGEVELNVRWMVLDASGKSALLVTQTKLSQKTSSRSYDALVDAYNVLLAKLANEMATAIQALQQAE